MVTNNVVESAIINLYDTVEAELDMATIIAHTKHGMTSLVIDSFLNKVFGAEAKDLIDIYEQKALLLVSEDAKHEVMLPIVSASLPSVIDKNTIILITHMIPFLWTLTDNPDKGTFYRTAAELLDVIEGDPAHIV